MNLKFGDKEVVKGIYLEMRGNNTDYNFPSGRIRKHHTNLVGAGVIEPFLNSTNFVKNTIPIKQAIKSSNTKWSAGDEITFLLEKSKGKYIEFAPAVTAKQVLKIKLMKEGQQILLGDGLQPLTENEALKLANHSGFEQVEFLFDKYLEEGKEIYHGKLIVWGNVNYVLDAEIS
jgi:hypothetical protein